MNAKQALLDSRFGKFGKSQKKRVTTGNVVVYTRVSTKEQADNNLSLATQKRTIEEYAKRQNLNITAYFGGTYESAKTDGRKEFQRMLDFVRKSKGQIGQVLVYALDRFSRTGGGAIKLVTDLREKHGIDVFAVTQPTDTANPSGILHQNIQLLFSEFDNQQRRQRVIAGMTEKFKQGIWVVKPPQGYDIIKINGNRSIVLNDEGKKIAKGFEWKAMGMKNEEIVLKLQKMGVKIYKQKIHKIFKNPFYCGLVCHGMLNGVVVKGKHEAMVSQELFMKVSDIISQSTRSEVPHLKENENLPLKIFIKCDHCGSPFTGYLMKARGIYYYKCRQKGCPNNKSAKQMNELFLNLLGEYTLKEKLMKVCRFHLEHLFSSVAKEQVSIEQALKANLTEMTKKLEKIEEKHFVLDEMNKETFDKFYAKFKKEQEGILMELAKLPKSSLNISGIIKLGLEKALRLPELWASGIIRQKEVLQNLVFPEGIRYNRETDGVRTLKVSELFAGIAQLCKGGGGIKKGTSPFLSGKSLSAEREDYEP